MGENIFYMKAWRQRKTNEFESLVPNPFKNLQEFLGYCATHSETPRALFSYAHARTLLKMADYPVEEINEMNFISIHEGEMNEILDIIKRKRNSIEAKFERVD